MENKKIYIIILFLFINICSKAATIYVNYSTGNDVSGNGTSGNPYKTFDKGYTMAATSDIIYLIGTFTWTNSDETGDAANTGYTISKSITIQGEGPGSTIVQAHASANTADRRVFTITNGYTVTFKNLQIRHGNSFSGYIGNILYSYYGGAIGSAYGGSNSVTLTLINVSITSNYSTTGGIAGVYSEGVFSADRCTFENNTSVSATSALELYYCGTQKVRNIINCTFYNNTNNTGHAAVFIDRKGANIVNTTFLNNTVAVRAYGLSNNSDELFITNSILANSTSYDLLTTSGSANAVKVSHSIVETESAAFATSYTTSIIGDQANLGISTPTTNGGDNTITPYLAITSGSVALDVGISSGTVGSTYSGGVISVPLLDQLNKIRFGGTYDMGAFEFGASATSITLDYSTSIYLLGSTSGTSITTSSNGLWMQKITPSLTTGNYAFYGDNNKTGISLVDLTTSACQLRTEKIWNIDVVGTVSTTDVIIDMSVASGFSILTDTPSNYKLLYRAGTSGDFTILASGSSVASSDQIKFSSVTLSDGYYALGTLDAVVSIGYTTTLYSISSTNTTSTTTSSTGLWMQKISPSLTTGNYANYGNNNTSETNTSDLVTSGCVKRSARIWYVDVTGTVSTTNVIIDISVSTGITSSTDVPSNYKLLYRAGTSGDFTILASGASVASSDQITFSPTTLSDGYYALGTQDAIAPTGYTTLVYPLWSSSGTSITASSNGLWMQKIDPSLTTGNYANYGNNNTSSTSTSDLTTSACLIRSARIWYVDVTGTVSTTNVIIDISDATGLTLVKTETPSNYKLLYRSSTTGDFTVLATGASVASTNDQITFSSVTLSDGYYALGTLDAFSPTGYTTTVYPLWSSSGTSITASSNGLWMQKITPALISGNQVYYANNNTTGISGSELTSTGCVIRTARIWYLDVTGTVSTTNIIFDHSDATGITFTTTDVSTNYKLLYRSGTTGDFSVLAIGTSIASTDQITFGSLTLTDGYYAIGIIDPIVALGYTTLVYPLWSSSTTNTTTSSTGLWMQKITPSLETGNHAYYGNNNISGLNGSDLANSGCQIRSGKIWYVDVTGTVSTTNVIIDISAATGVSLVTAETATNYKLLYRSGTSGDFTELAIGTSITSTDNVNFSPSALSTGYYALGVIDGFAAPDYTTSTYYLWITSGTSITTSSDGLWMQKISPALSTGNHVYYGNNNTSGFSTSDLTTSLCQLRTGRIWYVDVTGTVSTTNVIIDNSVATGTSITAATASNYKLLHRATTTGDFTVLATGASIASTDNITFSSVTLTTGYYALGTLNATSSPLPVELKSFTANIRNGIVNLNWTTATETANFGFDIERKSGNGNWIKLGFVKGNGTSASEKNYSFTDASVRKGKYSYRLKQIDRDAKFEYHKEAVVVIGIEPNKIVLDGNYPNPFNPTTKISFMLGTTSHATLKIYDILGKEIITLADGIFQENEIQEVNFNANNLTSGIYYYKLQSNNKTEIKKMVLMK